MIALFKVITESIFQAIQQLKGNKLRSFLSLLGITIGIFCIIGVQSAVDSLEANIRGSFEKLGNDVIYVSKFSWMEDPGQNYWKFMKNPDPNYQDFKMINKKVKSAALSSYHVFLGMKTAKFLSSSAENIATVAVTYDYSEMFSFKFEKGRYFSPAEYHYGTNQCVIGHKVAEELFGNIEPIGKRVKMLGRSLEVIGVLEKNGEDLVSVMNFDEALLISYELGKKVANLKDNMLFGNSVLSVKAADGIPVEQLRDEVTGVLRAQRRLKPRQKDNFALNELSLLSKVLDSFFSVLNQIGWIIGIFAIFIGVFSVANIMFVSVKERTPIIGIKKALGAKRYFILLEFLIESIILCVIGGIFGLLLVYGITTALTSALEFEIFLSMGNIITGFVLSFIIGIISGFIPAAQAASMDPVNAMRK